MILFWYLFFGLIVTASELLRLQSVIAEANDLVSFSLVVNHIARFLVTWPTYLYEDFIITKSNSDEEPPAEPPVAT